jgi:hypothetical protein
VNRPGMPSTSVSDLPNHCPPNCAQRPSSRYRYSRRSPWP